MPNDCQSHPFDFNLTTDQTGVFNSTLYRDVALPVNATVDQIDDIPHLGGGELQGTRPPLVLRPGPAL